MLGRVSDVDVVSERDARCWVCHQTHTECANENSGTSRECSNCPHFAYRHTLWAAMRCSSTVHVRDVESAGELLHRMDSCQVNSLVSAIELICVILVTVSWRPHLWDERLEQFLDDLQEKWGFVRPGNDPRSSEFDDFVACSC